MKKSVLTTALLLLTVSMTTVLAFAETKTFIKEYTYQASEFDSKVSCRVIALEQVKRLLLEELGTYLESQTAVQNFQITKDQIITLTAGIVKAEIVDEKWDGKTYCLKASISVDPDEVTKSLDIIRNDRRLVKELEVLKERAKEMSNEIARLRIENAKKTNNQESITAIQQRTLEKYNNAINELSTIEDESSFFFKKIIMLREGEKLITTVNANLFRGIVAVGGRMKITSERILFEPHRLNMQDAPRAIPLNEIVEIRKKNFLGLVPTGMVIRTKDGTEDTFVVWGREGLMKLIQSVMPQK